MSEKKTKIGFLKRIKMALFELENYIEFTEEKMSKAMFFAIKVSILLSLITVLSTIVFIKVKYSSLDNMANEVIPEFTYNDHKLEFTEDYNKDDSKVAVAYAGEKVTVVMSYAEGWTKVKYGKKEGYIRTDLLQ